MEVSTKRFVFSRPQRQVRRGAKTAVRTKEAPPADVSLDPEMTQRRAEALRNLFPQLFSWLASRAQVGSMHQASEYLANASNLADLEQRIRIVERRRAAL